MTTAPKLYFIQIMKPACEMQQHIVPDSYGLALEYAYDQLWDIRNNESETLALETEIRIATNDLDMFPYLPAEDNITVAYKEAGTLEIK